MKNASRTDLRIAEKAARPQSTLHGDAVPRQIGYHHLNDIFGKRVTKHHYNRLISAATPVISTVGVLVALRQIQSHSKIVR